MPSMGLRQGSEGGWQQEWKIGKWPSGDNGVHTAPIALTEKQEQAMGSDGSARAASRRQIFSSCYVADPCSILLLT